MHGLESALPEIFMQHRAHPAGIKLRRSAPEYFGTIFCL